MSGLSSRLLALFAPVVELARRPSGAVACTKLVHSRLAVSSLLTRNLKAVAAVRQMQGRERRAALLKEQTEGLFFTGLGVLCTMSGDIRLQLLIGGEALTIHASS